MRDFMQLVAVDVSISLVIFHQICTEIKQIQWIIKDDIRHVLQSETHWLEKLLLWETKTI